MPGDDELDAVESTVVVEAKKRFGANRAELHQMHDRDMPFHTEGATRRIRLRMRPIETHGRRGAFIRRPLGTTRCAWRAKLTRLSVSTSNARWSRGTSGTGGRTDGSPIPPATQRFWKLRVPLADEAERTLSARTA